MIGHLYRYPHPEDSAQFIYVGQGAKRDRRHRIGDSSFGRRFKQHFPSVELPQPIIETVEVPDQLALNEEETIWMFRFHTWHGYEDGMNLQIPGAEDYKKVGYLNALGGFASGRRAVKSGQLEKARKNRDKKEQSENGKRLGQVYGPVNGAVAGRKAVESGQILELGYEQGRKNVESGHMARIQKIGCQIGCWIGGRKNIESGHASSMGKKWGPINGLKTIEALAKYRTSEHQKEASQAFVEKIHTDIDFAKRVSEHSKKVMHNRWHVKRGIVSSICNFCQEAA